MSKKSSGYIDKAFENIEKDREKLEDLYDEILKLTKADPLVIATVGEPLVKIVDSLTKQNSQVVELAKIKQKEELVAKKTPTDSGFDQDEEEELWHEIDHRVE